MSKIKHYTITIVEVLVLQRFPYGKDSTFFYYAFGDTLYAQVGDVVSIPWRKGIKNGVVVKAKKTIVDELPEGEIKIDLNTVSKSKGYFFSSIPVKPIVLKPVKAVLEKKYLTPELLTKLRYAAKEYFVSWNHFAKSVVDVPAKKTRRGITAQNLFLPLLKKLNGVKTATAETFILKNVPKKKRESFIFASYEQQDQLKTIIQKTIQSGKQVLVTVPEKIHLLPTVAKYASLSNSFSISTPIPLGKFLPRSFSRSAWKLTRDKESYIFVSTRSGIFAPFRNLGLVIIENGHDMSHKQWDLAPLYDIRNLLNLFYPSVLKIYLSDTPRFEDFYVSPYYLSTAKKLISVKKIDPGTLEKQKINLHKTNYGDNNPRIFSRRVNFGKQKSDVFLVNTKVEKTISKTDTPISGYLKSKIIATLKKGKSIFLIANHKGIANLIICQDCGYVFRCPKCGKSLSQRSSFQLNCRFCGFKEQSMERCPRCSGFRIARRSYGIDKLEEDLKKIKTGLDFSLVVTPEANANYAEILKFTKKVISRGKPLVLLGYSGILPLGRFMGKRIGMAAILDFDEILFYPDFRSEERAAARFYNLLAIAPKVYIQTSDPTQIYLQKLINNTYSSLFKDWMVERRNFCYPPVANILRIDIPNSRFMDAKKIASVILSEFKKEGSVLEAMEVSVTGVSRINKYSSCVVVKYKSKDNIILVIDKLFKKFGNLRIDPDPEEL